MDGAIGEGSDFHEMFGIYGQGVSVTTAVLPAGWTTRLVAYDRDDAEPSEARCLDAHDLVVSKLVAGRDKDLLFARVLVQAGLISCATLRDRAQQLDVVPGATRRVLGFIVGTEDRLTPDYEDVYVLGDGRSGAKDVRQLLACHRRGLPWLSPNAAST